MKKSNPQSVHEKIRRAFLLGYHQKKEILVDDLCNLVDMDRKDITALARYTLIGLAEAGIFYFRRWAKEPGKRMFIRAFKWNSGSDEDRAEAIADLDRDFNQIDGRNKVLGKRVNCAQETKLLKPRQAKRYILLPGGEREKPRLKEN
jgi:hypothetical protein